MNWLPTKILQNHSPFNFFFFFQNSPDYNLLRVFGCACWPNLRPYNAHKLQPRSIKCGFLGYNLHHRGYKCLYISQDVLFEESVFPFATTIVQHSLVLILHSKNTELNQAI